MSIANKEFVMRLEGGGLLIYHEPIIDKIIFISNTQLSGAAISSTVFEIYAALAASAGAGVRKDSLHLPRFFLELKYSLYFFHEFAFCSFMLCIHHQILPYEMILKGVSSVAVLQISQVRLSNLFRFEM